MTGEPPGPRSEIHRRTIRLRAAFEAADDLLTTLAGTAACTESGPAWWNLTLNQHAVANSAANRALRRVAGWAWQPDHAYGASARFTIVDAVTAVELRTVFPALADELASGWATAVAVRDQLRPMGPEAESTALRLLPDWQQSPTSLPFAVRGILDQPSPSHPEAMPAANPEPGDRTGSSAAG